MPAELACATAAWTGPATGPRLEALLCDARTGRVRLERPGQVRSLQTLTDGVILSQRRALAARDGGCTARGCAGPPAFCDAHHLVELCRGGTTAMSDLVLLCRRHHVSWHRGRLGLVDLHVPRHRRRHPPRDRHRPATAVSAVSPVARRRRVVVAVVHPAGP